MATKKTEENEILETEETPVKKTTKESKTESEAEKRVAELEAQLKQMQQMMMAMMTNQANMNAVTTRGSLDDEIKIIHLVERDPGLTTHIQLSNLSIDMQTFGEERTLDRRQAEELVGKYRKLFDKGILAFGADHDEIAKKFKIKTINAYDYAKTDFVAKLGTLNLSELEDLYRRLCDGHKAFIIEYFKKQIIKNNAAFKDIHKIELLNRLSGGSMDTVLLDLKNKK